MDCTNGDLAGAFNSSLRGASRSKIYIMDLEARADDETTPEKIRQSWVYMTQILPSTFAERAKNTRDQFLQSPKREMVSVS